MKSKMAKCISRLSTKKAHFVLLVSTLGKMKKPKKMASLELEHKC